MERRRLFKLVLPLAVVAFLAAGALLAKVQGVGEYAGTLLAGGSKVAEVQPDLTSLGYDTYGADSLFEAEACSVVVNLPKETNAAPSRGSAGISRPSVYTVVAGDTLGLIADRFHTSVSLIKANNNLSGDMIYPGQKLAIDGTARFAAPAGKKPSAAPAPSRGGESRFGQLVAWDKAKGIFQRGMTAVVTDLETGLSWRVKRMGGSLHADCEPVSAADTAKMKQVYGGEWSWARRPIIVSVAGMRIAASQHGMPHGGKTVQGNNFPGHFCIHFLGSMVHGSNQYAPGPAHVDAAHQAAVRRAAGL